jgi:hypothetical protein
MGLAGAAAHRWWGAGGGRLDSLMELAVVIPAAIVVYAVTLLVLRGEEARWVVRGVRRILPPAMRGTERL